MGLWYELKLFSNSLFLIDDDCMTCITIFYYSLLWFLNTDFVSIAIALWLLMDDSTCGVGFEKFASSFLFIQTSDNSTC